jgi:Protein of unknown function (DUF4238)
MGGPERAPNAVSHQHYVPEFYLKRFASDAARLKIMTMTRRHTHLIEEERSIKYTCAKTRIYRDREEVITRLENVVQRSATWNGAIASRKGPLSTNDAKDIFRTVNHFSIRTPLSRGFLRRLAQQGVDFSRFGSDLNNAFENMSTAYEAWDTMFHLTSVRILHTDTDLLTSAFPTSSFEDGLDVDDITYRYHVSMAIDRRVLAHVMVKGFDSSERVKQQFWIAPAEDQIVLRHNLAQIGRFAGSEDVEYLVHTGISSSTDLIHRCLSALGWYSKTGRRGQRVFVHPSATDLQQPRRDR